MHCQGGMNSYQSMSHGTEHDPAQWQKYALKVAERETERDKDRDRDRECVCSKKIALCT